MMRAAVVGAGSWGTAFAVLAEASGLDTRLVCRTQAQADRIRASRVNPRYLPAVTIPPSIHPVALEDPRCLDDVDLVVLALPSRRVREAAEFIVPRLGTSVGVLSLTKGLDPEDGRWLSETWRGLLPPGTPLCILSGPNHAEEISVRQPTAAVVAGDPDLARRIQGRLSGPRFRLYVNDDLVGVELCGAAKNVIAIAAGMSDGVGFGDNCKATLMTRGLAEMTRLGRACGAREATFRGLAGMGDLIATCTSRHSRNRRAGEMIARGVGADLIEGDIGQVAEGLWTVRHLLALAEQHAVELPISAEVAAVAFGGRPVHSSLEALMARAPIVEG